MPSVKCKKMSLDLVENTKQMYVLLVLTYCVSTIACFDLMMFLFDCEFLGSGPSAKTYCN
jgi:hypothetical protein